MKLIIYDLFKNLNIVYQTQLKNYNHKHHNKHHNKRNDKSNPKKTKSKWSLSST